MPTFSTPRVTWNRLMRTMVKPCPTSYRTCCPRNICEPPICHRKRTVAMPSTLRKSYTAISSGDTVEDPTPIGGILSPNNCLRET